MAWKDNPVGIVVDKTMNVDFAALKAAGFSFVVIEAGLGFDSNPALPEQIQKAASAGLPVIAQWTPHPAYDDYTFDGVAQEQIAIAQRALTNKTYGAYVTSVERWWTGFDLENGHNPVRQATDQAINHVAYEFSHSFNRLLTPTERKTLIRTNDSFVQTYCPPMGQGWTDNFGFFLADWRYRTRAADGSWSVFTKVPAHTFSDMSTFRAAMPPDTSKNPLVPGMAPQIKFWEFTGSLYMPTSMVKGWDGSTKKCKAVLFNGDEAVCYSYLKHNTVPVDPPEDPGDPPVDPGDPETPVDLQPVIDLLEIIAADVHAIYQDIHDIRLKFS